MFPGLLRIELVFNSFQLLLQRQSFLVHVIHVFLLMTSARFANAHAFAQFSFTALLVLVAIVNAVQGSDSKQVLGITKRLAIEMVCKLPILGLESIVSVLQSECNQRTVRSSYTTVGDTYQFCILSDPIHLNERQQQIVGQHIRCPIYALIGHKDLKTDPSFRQTSSISRNKELLKPTVGLQQLWFCNGK